MALSISRRSFMKCVGITAFATATGTLMTGCAQGPITGDFGGPFPLSPMVNVAVYKMQSSEFDIGLSEIGSYLDQNWIDLPFGANISDLTGYICTMPEAAIQNNSDQTLLVLPYFTQNSLETVVDDLAKKYLQENQETVTKALEKILVDNEKTISSYVEKLEDIVIVSFKTLWGSEIKIKIKDLMNALRGILGSTTPQEVEKFLLEGTSVFGYKIYGLPQWDEKYPGVTELILDEIMKLLKTEILEKLGSSLNFLMVHGQFDGNAGESDLDQVLNVASAGYALLRNKQTLMTNTIAPGATATGLLPIPSKKRWKTLFLRFLPNDLLLQFQDGFMPNWDHTANLIVKLLVYLFFKNSSESADCLKAVAAPTVQLITSSMDYLDYNIQPISGSLVLRFENGSTI